MRNRGLDLCKLICILFVMVSHFGFARDLHLFPLVIDMAVPVFMVISGYVNTRSIEKKGLNRYYAKESFIPKLSRFILPFLVVMFLASVAFLLNGGSVKTILGNLVYARWGSGSYYPYVLVQFVLIFPWLLKWSETKGGIFGILAVNVVFELMTTLGIVPLWIYRIAVFRLLGFILAGILIAKNEKKIKNSHIIAVLLAGLIISLVNIYMPERFIFNTYIYVSLPAAFWASGLMLVFLKLPEKIVGAKMLNIFTFFGTATYHILLTQMICYSYCDSMPLVLIIGISIATGAIWHMADNIVQAKIKNKLMEKTI